MKVKLVNCLILGGKAAGKTFVNIHDFSYRCHVINTFEVSIPFIKAADNKVNVSMCNPGRKY